MNTYGRIAIIFITIICFSKAVFAQMPYQDTLLSPAERAEDLLSRLTLDEKTSLMMNSSQAVPRLGIPQYNWWSEALHGVARNGTATVFPQSIGMAASFDDKLVKTVFTIVSDEARIKHRQAREQGAIERYEGLTVWTPNINLFRDPRWGRGQETYGEDPYLTSKMGLAVIQGLQGDENEKYAKLFACAKHYAVHSGPEWNRHSFNAENINPRDLWETYLPAFKTAILQGKVGQVMCAYSRFEGDPCCGSDSLMIRILRKKWGFDGVVVSDCGAIDNFYKKGRHETHQDQVHAVAAAVLSGTDLECGHAYEAIPEAIEQGLITEKQLDVSLKRVLKARFKLGEIDGYSPWDNLPDSLLNCQQHRNLSLEMARKSIVLLKNNGILPLARDSRIALIGPAANDSTMQWGNYHGIPRHTVTLLGALNPWLKSNGVVFNIEKEYTRKYVSLFKECGFKKIEGFSVSFWNNVEMQGNPVCEDHIVEPVDLPRRKKWAPELDMNDVSARFVTTFTPTKTGSVEFVIISPCQVKIQIDGRVIEQKYLPRILQIAEFEVNANQQYEIAIDVVRDDNNGEFKFDLQRQLKPDFEKLVDAVKEMDVVVFAGGISAELEREEYSVYAPGFQGGDRTHIELPQLQRDMITALKLAGKKVVLVNFSGSAVGLVPESKNCEAILQAWYPGEAGGKAIVDVLFGEYNPSGRLPVTFYRNAEQLPDFENYDMIGRTYRYMTENPLYPFGYGLSYTTYQYGSPELDKTQIKVGEEVTLTIPVTNTGDYDGEEVVQVYLKKYDDPNGPIKALRSFIRVFISSGETKNVVIKLTDENLEWWDSSAGSIHMYPGEFQVMIGGSSRTEDLRSLSLEIQ